MKNLWKSCRLYFILLCCFPLVFSYPLSANTRFPFRDLVYTASDIRSDDSLNISISLLDREGLALLPLYVLEGFDGFRRPFSEAFDEALSSQISKYLPWEETLNIIEEAGKVQEYNDTILSYKETDILDPIVLDEIANLSGYNYFLLIEVILPISGKRGRMYSSKRIGAFGVLWDVSEKKIVWEGHSELNGYAYYSDRDLAAGWPDTDLKRLGMVAEAFVNHLVKESD